MARMMFLMEMLETRPAIGGQRVVRDRTNPLDSLDDLQLCSRYRFHRNQPLEMVQEIRSQIEHRTRRNVAVSTENAFLTVLRFYATQYPQIWLSIFLSTLSFRPMQRN